MSNNEDKITLDPNIELLLKVSFLLSNDYTFTDLEPPASLNLSLVPDYSRILSKQASKFKKSTQNSLLALKMAKNTSQAHKCSMTEETIQSYFYNKDDDGLFVSKDTYNAYRYEYLKYKRIKEKIL